MEKAEILKKVKQREYEKRCVNVKICPECGGNLVTGEDGHLLDHVCKACNLSWPYT